MKVFFIFQQPYRVFNSKFNVNFLIIHSLYQKNKYIRKALSRIENQYLCQRMCFRFCNRGGINGNELLGVNALFQKVLLRTDDGAGPAHAQPGDALGGRELVVLHEIAGDERAGATETRFAVHGHGARTRLAYLEELLDDEVARRTAVDEEEIVVLEAGVHEPLGVVDLLVEAYDALDVVLAKVARVGLGRVQRVAVLDLALRVRTRERQELLRQDPVEVTVFHFLLY